MREFSKMTIKIDQVGYFGIATKISVLSIKY